MHLGGKLSFLTCIIIHEQNGIGTKMEKPRSHKKKHETNGKLTFSTEINDLIRVENEIMHTIKQFKCTSSSKSQRN
jgi:hypothetical protein